MRGQPGWRPDSDAVQALITAGRGALLLGTSRWSRVAGWAGGKGSQQAAMPCLGKLAWLLGQEGKALRRKTESGKQGVQGPMLLPPCGIKDGTLSLLQGASDFDWQW
jgi:hypothetical protein